MTVLAMESRRDELAKQLEQGIKTLGVELGFETQLRLLQHLELLEKWNRVHNLTAIRDKARAISVHLLDSLSVVPLWYGPAMMWSWSTVRVSK